MENTADHELTADQLKVMQENTQRKEQGIRHLKLPLQSEAGIYQYGQHGHKKVQQSKQQKQMLEQFKDYMEKDNEDILLIPAKKAIKIGFGICKDNGNPFNIASNLSIPRGRNYIQQQRDINSYSINVHSRIPNFKQ